MLRDRTLAFIAILFTSAACSSSQDRVDGPLTSEQRNTLTGTIYFASEHGHDEPPTIQSVSPAGTALREHKTLEGAFVYGSSPDHKLIISTIADDIIVSRADGSDARPVAVSDQLEWYPRFSPDGQWILFESARESFRDIYKVSVDGKKFVRLTDNREGNFDAGWSPDGRKIAFASSRAGSLDVWVMNADGSEQKRLTSHAGDSVKPAFGPLGKHIAFISGRDRQDDIYVIRPDGTAMTKLSAPRGEGAPVGVERYAWHPTQARIVYAARELGGKSRIFVVDANTGARTQLTPKTVTQHEVDPAWSPDGNHLVFASGGEIYLARADGSGRTRISDTGGHAWLPRWLTIDEKARKTAQEKAK